MKCLSFAISVNKLMHIHLLLMMLNSISTKIGDYLVIVTMQCNMK